MERNSDLIIMSSYAPLFVNVNPGGKQWESDLIGYDAAHAYGSPGYYAQSIFAEYLGSEVPTSSLSGGGDRFFYSVTRDPAKGRRIPETRQRHVSSSKRRDCDDWRGKRITYSYARYAFRE